jgi:transcription-repair coupling factor (superfamily II helicase)
LSRFRSAAQQRETVKKLAVGTVDIVVGTHRILSKDVYFKKLGLVIIDEEQRFGVRQKEALRKLRAQAHVLTLSATPLPRTLHLALSGVRGISTITTPPPGRLGIESFVTPYDPEMIQRAIQHELERRGQVYFLHNDVDTIRAKAHELQSWFPEARIDVAHGQLPEQELARVMHAFDTQAVDILVCSTIIENGLDIPHANTLIVERATQFGLAQLHQLRGRIGRGSTQAYAYFFYHSRDLTDDAKLRLKALEEAQELGVGFELAMRDMEIRGVGSILGKHQHGHAEAIGLNFYSRLLSSAVRQLKEGKNQPPIRDIPIDVPLSATIPEDVVPDEGERIQLYQQFANIRELPELLRVRDQWTPKGPEFVQLFQLLYLHLLAQQSPIVSIDTIYPNAANRLDSEKIVIKTLLPIPYGFITAPFERVDEHTVRVYKNQMKEDWVGTLSQWMIELTKAISS